MNIKSLLINSKKLNPDLINRIKIYNQSSNYGTTADESLIDTSPIHEICNEINTIRPFSKFSQTKLKLFIDLYEIIPDYSILIYMRQNYNTYSISSKKFYWRKYRQWLNRNTTYSIPVKYSLECDWFTDKQSSKKAWSELIKKPLNNNYVRNLIDCSGPVNEDIKNSFFNYLKTDKRLKNTII